MDGGLGEEKKERGRLATEVSSGLIVLKKRKKRFPGKPVVEELGAQGRRPPQSCNVHPRPVEGTSAESHRELRTLRAPPQSWPGQRTGKPRVHTLPGVMGGVCRAGVRGEGEHSQGLLQTTC